MPDNWKDGGWKSRKMWFSLYCISLMSYMATKDIDSIKFDALVTGIIGVSGLFLAGNVGTKWVASKSPASSTATKTEASPVPREESSPS